MGIQPNPVVIQGESLRLDHDVPLVREQLNRVVPMVINLFQQAGRLAELSALRERLAK